MSNLVVRHPSTDDTLNFSSDFTQELIFFQSFVLQGMSVSQLNETEYLD